MSTVTTTRKRTPARTPAEAPMTEAQLQDAVLDLARFAGYLAYHTFDSRRSAPGFPDLVLVHADPRIGRAIYAELKTERGRLRHEQMQWLTALEASGHEVHVWRPRDWRSGAIEAVLLTPLAIAGRPLPSRRRMEVS